MNTNCDWKEMAEYYGDDVPNNMIDSLKALISAIENYEKAGPIIKGKSGPKGNRMKVLYKLDEAIADSTIWLNIMKEHYYAMTDRDIDRAIEKKAIEMEREIDVFEW